MASISVFHFKYLYYIIYFLLGITQVPIQRRNIRITPHTVIPDNARRKYLFEYLYYIIIILLGAVQHGNIQIAPHVFVPNIPEITNCHNNFTVSRREIIRKLRFKPLPTAVGFARASPVLPIIRANYFCYTFNELMYTLYVTDMYGRDSDLILASYLETIYVNEGQELVTKFFCNRINNRCQTIYNFLNPNKNLLSSSKNSFHQYVFDKPTLLSLITEFKKCDTRGSRLYVWTGMDELKRINSYIPVVIGSVEIDALIIRIFNTIREM